MQDETAVVVVKASVAAPAGGLTMVAAFGVSLPMLLVALAAAMLGVVVSMHKEPPAKGSTVWRVLFQIFAMGVFAAALAISVEHFDLTASIAKIPLGLRAVLAGAMANLLWNWVTGFINRKRRDTTGEG